jgi:hypothetical protein
MALVRARNMLILRSETYSEVSVVLPRFVWLIFCLCLESWILMSPSAHQTSQAITVNFKERKKSFTERTWESEVSQSRQPQNWVRWCFTCSCTSTSEARSSRFDFFVWKIFFFSLIEFRAVEGRKINFCLPYGIFLLSHRRWKSAPCRILKNFTRNVKCCSSANLWTSYFRNAATVDERKFARVIKWKSLLSKNKFEQINQQPEGGKHFLCACCCLLFAIRKWSWKVSVGCVL